MVSIGRRLRFSEGAMSLTPLGAEGALAVARVNQKRREGRYDEVHHDCACGCVDDEIVATRERFGFEMTTVICRKCGLVRTDPMLSDTAWAEFYANEFLQLFGSQYGERKGTLDQIHEEERKKGVAIYRQHFAPLLQRRGPLRVADVGCGTGGVMRAFAAQGHAVVGCDVSEATTAHGRKMGVETLAGSIDVLAPHGPFDVVLLNHVLEHVTEPNPFLREVASLMREEGYLYVALPSIRDLSWPRYRWDILRFLRFYHPYAFCLGTLTQVVGRHRFRLTKGDEWIQSVFTYKGAGGAVPEPQNYYAEIKCYLRQAEWKRRAMQLLRQVRSESW